MEHYLFERIENILIEILGETRRGFSDDLQAQFNCPCCADENGGTPDNKYNLEVNLYKQVYLCWKCSQTHGTSGSLLKLVRQYGTPAQYKEYKEELYAIQQTKLYDIDFFSGGTVNHEEKTVIYPKTYRKIDLSKTKNKRLLDFLAKRRIDQACIDRFSIGITTWDEADYSMRNRLIVPSYDSYGDLNYWVGRDFTGFQKAKYKNCTVDKKSIVYQENLINYDNDIYLVEGVLDSLRLPNTIAMLGKILTKDTKLFSSLYSKAKGNIFIILDQDTQTKETKQIYKLLNVGRLEGKIFYADMKESPYKDFSEAYENGGKKALIDIIRGAKKFSDLELCLE